MKKGMSWWKRTGRKSNKDMKTSTLLGHQQGVKKKRSDSVSSTEVEDSEPLRIRAGNKKIMASNVQHPAPLPITAKHPQLLEKCKADYRASIVEPSLPPTARQETKLSSARTPSKVSPRPASRTPRFSTKVAPVPVNILDEETQAETKMTTSTSFIKDCSKLLPDGSPLPISGSVFAISSAIQSQGSGDGQHRSKHRSRDRDGKRRRRKKRRKKKLQSRMDPEDEGFLMMEGDVSPLPSLIFQSPSSAPRTAVIMQWLVEVAKINEDDAHCYAAALDKEGYDDLDALNLLDEAELIEIIGVKRGHAKKILKRVGTVTN